LTASIDNVLFEPHSVDLKQVFKNWSTSGISSWYPEEFLVGLLADLLAGLLADLLAALPADLLACPLLDGVAPATGNR
jgi:hypothetical protein